MEITFAFPNGIILSKHSCHSSECTDSYCWFLFQVKKEVGDVSILINNAGIVTGKKFLDCPDSLIEKTMEVNTMANIWVTDLR